MQPASCCTSSTEDLFSRASCVALHNVVLLEWLQHRAQSRVDRGLQLPHCDVNLMQVTEKEVCYGLLKSMQLMDLVEMHRWYTVTLALCTSDDTACGSYSDRRGRTPKDSNKKPKATAGTCCGDDSVCGHSGTTLPAVDGQGGAGGG